jgi:putative ABC transport system permease protein
MKKNFATYVNEYRIKEAIRLLSENSNDTISYQNVAFDVGFNDQRNFNRVFKKMTGLTPSEFRNNLDRQ